MVKNSKGYALVIVLILMLVMAMVGATLLSTSLSDTKLTVAQVKNKQAYYAARSGADAMASYIDNHSSELQALIINTTSAYATGSIGTNASFKVKVIKDTNGDGNVKIQSTGIVDGVQRASVTLTIRMNPTIGSALFGSNSLTLGNGVTIKGDIATNANMITFGSADQKINGNITLGIGADPTYVTSIAGRATGTVQKMFSPIVIKPIDPSLFTLLWTNQTVISLKKDDKIYVKAYKSDISTIIGNIVSYAKANANNNTIKPAQIHLFVTDQDTNVQFLPSNIHLPDGISLFIYYNGDNKGSSIVGNGAIDFNHVVVYAPNAKFAVNGGGSGEFLKGTIIVSDLLLPNSSASFASDPFINFNDIAQYESYTTKTYGN